MTNITVPIQVNLPNNWVDQIIDRLRNDPDADWINVIRCKDCNYGKQDDDGWWYCKDTGYSMGDGEKGNGFCSNAERKINEDD